MKIVYGTEPYRIDHEVRKLAENTTYYVQVFDAIDGVKEFLQSISFFGIPCAIYKVEDVKKERKELLHLMEECPESSCLIIRKSLTTARTGMHGKVSMAYVVIS